MDTTPPSHRSETRSRIKSASRLSRLSRFDEESESLTPRVSLEIVPSPRIEVSPYGNGLPLHELLLLSPSPLRRSKTRLADKLDLADDGVEPNGVRRRRRSRNSAIGASPRNNRRSRRRLEQEMREERDLGLVEEVVKPRKKRNNGKSKKDKLSLLPSSTSTKSKEGEGCDLINRVEIFLNDLVMWRDVARSSLWFGLGSLCFLSSCFAKGVTFRSIAEYLSRDYPYKLSPNDVHVTAGAKQAIDVLIKALAVPGANILLPRPGYPSYEALATFSRLEMRHYDLLPERDWEVDIDELEALADDRTVAMVVINPGNPCGNVYRTEHLKKIAEAARKLGVLVISDEAYGHLVFGSNPFVPMGVFGEIAPILTIGSISKRWMVPGWRFGWIVMCDPNGILQKHGVVESIKNYLDISAKATTLMLGAITRILVETPEDFYSNTINLLRKAADICYAGLREISCFTPYKSQGSMFLMAKLNISFLEGIENDMEFCTKLAREESVVVLPGEALGLKNWVRVTFAVEISALEDGLSRIKAFCFRHAKQQ